MALGLNEFEGKKTGVKANCIIFLLVGLLALLAFLPFKAEAKAVIRTEYGVVEKGSDGDTIEAIADNGTKLKVRLYGIDAPETAKVTRKGLSGSRGSRSVKNPYTL